MAYYIYNKGLHALISHEKQASLKEATHPDRVRRLNEEARKARDKQQLELQKSAQEYTKKQAQKQLEQKTQNLAKLSQDGGRTLKHKNDYSPLDPNAKGSSRYQPGTFGDYGNRRRRRGGG